jgi:hypothetical protein
MQPVGLSAAVLAGSLAVSSLALLADDPAPVETPAYADTASEVMLLDNGMVLQGSGVSSPDGYTSGFRVVAGYTPLNLPRFDLGAELSYRESDEVPTAHAGESLLLNTTSLGGSLIAGVRFGRFGLYAKTGYADWVGDPVTPREAMNRATAGTARVQGFGARWQVNRLVSRLEVEEIDAPSMAHLNLITASIHYQF